MIPMENSISELGGMQMAIDTRYGTEPTKLIRKKKPLMEPALRFSYRRHGALSIDFSSQFPEMRQEFGFE